MTRLLILLTPTLIAADWPQFLGAGRDGASPEPIPTLAAKPEVLWRAPVGPSHSSPVVAAGKVYAFYQPKGAEADALAAYDAKTGAKLWEKRYARGPFTTPFGTGPRSTPTVDGSTIVTFGPTGVLCAWDAATGEIRWQVDALKKYAAPNLLFGVSASPLVAAGKVVVPVGGKGAGLVAFDLKTGGELWHASDDPASYSSPVVSGDTVVALTGSHLRAVTLATGKPVWQVAFKDALNESSTTPVLAGPTLIASSVTRGSAAFTAAAGSPSRVWANPELTCYFSTPIVVGEQVYMVTGAATMFSASVALKCVELKSGKVNWTEPNLGKYHAALLKTGDGNLLMLDDTGRLTLFKPNAKAFEVIGRAKVCGATWAHPALCDGVVFVRDDKELIAVKIKS